MALFKAAMTTEKAEAKAKPKGEGKGAEPMDPEKNMRTCSQCKKQEHWRRMKADWVDTTGTPSPSALDVKDSRQGGHYQHTCVACYAKETDTTLEEATRTIKQPHTAKKMERAKKYKEETWRTSATSGSSSRWNLARSKTPPRRMAVRGAHRFHPCRVGR